VLKNPVSCLFDGVIALSLTLAYKTLGYEHRNFEKKVPMPWFNRPILRILPAIESLVLRLEKDRNQTGLKLQKTGPAV
jgi:hypothetical protein